MAKLKTPRWGWALTGSGHFFKECLRMAGDFDDVDLFVSKAAGEVVRMYRQEFKLPAYARIFRDTTASAAPVGLFYYGVYHTLILAPATSNTVAKCVLRHFGYACHQRLCASGKMPSAGNRFCLRYRAGARDGSA